MKSTRNRILIIGAALVLVAAVAVAEGHGFGGPMGSFHHMLKQLDLTSDQQAQVKAIWQKEKPAMRPLMEQMRQNHQAMQALQASGPYDEAKTRALATQNSQAMIELEVAHQRIKSEIMQVLTAEQKAKLAQIEANHQAHAGRQAPPPEE